MHYLIATISLFDEMFCLDIFRRSTRQRGLPGTTSITQTTWAVSTSSARSPLVCSTCWMRRASKNRWFTRFHSCLMADFFFLILILLKLPIALISSFYLSFFPLFSTLCLYSSFPHATDETLLAKFKQQHQGNKYFVPTPVMEPAFVIRHFAGKVKYQVKVRLTSREDIRSNKQKGLNST